MKKITNLLRENNLSHFKYDQKQSRIIHDYSSTTFTHMNDFNKLLRILKDNNIRHNNMGFDVIFLEKD